LAQALLGACGSERSAVQAWLGRANQTAYARLAPLVLAHGASDPVARAILEQAGKEVARIAAALDASGALPLALCGGLGEALLPWLPPPLRARCQAPQMDAASGALLMLARTPGAQR
jgi:glucosamine kinase